MSDDFSNAPVSLAETKATKAAQSALWTPRDALIKMLREIDNGEIKPQNITIVYTEDLSGKVMVGTFHAGPAEIYYRLGMLQDAASRLLYRE